MHAKVAKSAYEKTLNSMLNWAVCTMEANISDSAHAVQSINGQVEKMLIIEPYLSAVARSGRERIAAGLSTQASRHLECQVYIRISSPLGTLLTLVPSLINAS